MPLRRQYRNRLLAGLWALLWIVVWAFASTEATAQVSARASGYLEHQFSVTREGSEWTYLDYDRFRVELNALAGRRTQVSAGVIWQLYRGDTRLDLRDYVPASLAPLVDSSAIHLENRHYVNHAFVVLRPGSLQITAGKQYLNWGAAWVFNPTELFRPKNALEPTYDREGVGALSLKVPLGALSDLEIGFVPDGSLGSSGKLLRVRHHVGGFDVSALAAVLHEPVAGASGGRAASEARRVTLGGDVTGEVIGMGTWLEATWSDYASERWVEATLGGNYTLENGTLLMVEGFYNGRGARDAPYAAADWLGRLSGDVRTLGRVLVYGHASRLFGQLWTLGFSVLANPGDGSAVVIPSVAYAFAQDVDVLFNALIYAGGEEAEFGANRVGGFLRARVYF